MGPVQPDGATGPRLSPGWRWDEDGASCLGVRASLRRPQPSRGLSRELRTPASARRRS